MKWQRPDSFHLQAAAGWIELGNWAEANEELAKLIPDEPFPYVRAAFALHELKRTEEALNILLPVADRFTDEWVVPYNLACYCSQLGRIEEAEQWFKLAMSRDEGTVKQAAIDDPDLMPLWEGKRGAKRKKAD